MQKVQRSGIYLRFESLRSRAAEVLAVKFSKSDNLSDGLLFTMLGTAGISVVHVKKLGEEILGEDLSRIFFSPPLLERFPFPGHVIDEIRLRALDNIVSKYDLGFACDCDAVKKEIVQGLFNWFSFETAPQPEKVLDLLLRLLKVLKLVS